MFGIAWPELLLIAIVAIIAIGPKDLPPLMRQAGKFARSARQMWNEMRGHFDELSTHVDLEDSQREADKLQKKVNTPHLEARRDEDKAI
jgi:sec-independent protein translocase protein TatB